MSQKSLLFSQLYKNGQDFIGIPVQLDSGTVMSKNCELDA